MEDTYTAPPAPPPSRFAYSSPGFPGFAAAFLFFPLTKMAFYPCLYSCLFLNLLFVDVEIRCCIMNDHDSSICFGYDSTAFLLHKDRKLSHLWLESYVVHNRYRLIYMAKLASQ